jgi:hypothetical protein
LDITFREDNCRAEKDSTPENSLKKLLLQIIREQSEKLTDPRVERTKDHLMEAIIFITIAAVICGAETWNGIEQYGKSKQS